MSSKSCPASHVQQVMSLLFKSSSWIAMPSLCFQIDCYMSLPSVRTYRTALQYSLNTRPPLGLSQSLSCSYIYTTLYYFFYCNPTFFSVLQLIIIRSQYIWTPIMEKNKTIFHKQLSHLQLEILSRSIPMTLAKFLNHYKAFRRLVIT